MHTLNIPPAVLDRIVARRGRLHMIEAFEPPRTAVLAVDMQVAYLSPDQPGFSQNGVEIIPAVNALIHPFRRAGGTIVWLRNTLAESPGAWQTYAMLRKPDALDRMMSALAKDSKGHQISPGMDVVEGDLILDKWRYSAFIQGSSDLDVRLREREIDTLVIAGVLTNVCCESTARDAMMLDYRVVMAADATAAHTNEEYNGSLTSILFAFGDVMTNAEIFERLEMGLPALPRE